MVGGAALTDRVVNYRVVLLLCVVCVPQRPGWRRLAGWGLDLKSTIGPPGVRGLGGTLLVFRHQPLFERSVQAWGYEVYTEPRLTFSCCLVRTVFSSLGLSSRERGGEGRRKEKEEDGEDKEEQEQAQKEDPVGGQGWLHRGWDSVLCNSEWTEGWR